MLVECLTDNRNRAASDVRVAFTRNGGQMADPGSVAYVFSRKGVVMVPAEGTDEDTIMEPSWRPAPRRSPRWVTPSRC